jgi:hypothetical protein
MKKSQLRHIIREVIREVIIKERDRDMQGRRDYEGDYADSISACPPEGRWITATDCNNNTFDQPCVLVDNNIPQLGQSITPGVGSPIHEITNVQSAATWPNNPGIFNQNQLTAATYVVYHQSIPNPPPCPKPPISPITSNITHVCYDFNCLDVTQIGIPSAQNYVNNGGTAHTSLQSCQAVCI